jgi:hypothetical protein
MKGTPLRLAILFFCATGTVLILQSAFDASDHRKAERAVRNYTDGGAKALGALVEERAPGGAWTTEITHGCRGIVRVRYQAGASLYEWDYEVPSHTIHPANPAGAELLTALVEAAPKHPPDGGAATPRVP